MATPSHDYQLDAIAAMLEREHPHLQAPIRPLAVLGDGYVSLAVQTASGIVIRLPKRPDSAAVAAASGRLLSLLGPTLPVNVPVPAWQGAPSSACPWGFSAYRKVEGMQIDVAALDAAATQRLAAQLGTFLAALHAFPLETARALGVANDWRGHYVELGADVMPELERRLELVEFRAVAAWWRAFLDDDRNWRYAPALVHGDVGPEHLLLDPSGNLVGVIDFDDACIGDPAVDFGGLVAYVDARLGDAAYAAYCKDPGDGDPDLPRRARILAAATPFFSIAAAMQFEDPTVPTIDEALALLRASPMVRGA
jgi:aminoglycoside 2''-phosphotransferase